MIKFYDQVPSIYPSASRDFQYLSWLINIVLNSVKHNVDDLYDLPNTKSDPRLAELLAMTLGFKVKRSYDQKQLAALVSIIPSILKHKGTEQAVSMAAKALINASGATGEFSCKIENNLLEVILPKDLIDITLFTDLLPYILPAGLACRIIRKTQYENKIKTDVYFHTHEPKAEWHPDLSWNADAQTSSGLAGLFNTGLENNEPNFANYKENGLLNAGLLDNTIIPLLKTGLTEEE